MHYSLHVEVIAFIWNFQRSQKETWRRSAKLLMFVEHLRIPHKLGFDHHLPPPAQVKRSPLLSEERCKLGQDMENL